MQSVVGEGQAVAQDLFNKAKAQIETTRSTFKPQIDAFESLAEKLKNYKDGGTAALGRLSPTEAALSEQTAPTGIATIKERLEALDKLRNAEVAAQMAKNDVMTRSQLEAAHAEQAQAQAEAVARGSFKPQELRDQVKIKVNEPKGNVKGLLPWHHSGFPRFRSASILGVGPYLVEKGYENLVQPLLYGNSKNPDTQPGTFLEEMRDSTALNERMRKLIAAAQARNAQPK
jgi:hypothetical protein